MEYGVFISETRRLPEDPREICAEELRPLLPQAPLGALYFGSEFCEHLLPSLPELERLSLFALRAGVEGVLLTPVATPGGLSAIERLVGEAAGQSWAPSVVVNDWGVLTLLRRSFPGLRLRGGRLMNRSLRDPRLSSSPGAVQGGGGERVRSLLLGFGVEALETDADLEGSHLPEREGGLQRVLHFPYVFAASGRNCLIKAEGASSAEECFTKGLSLPCPGLCRGRSHEVTRGDVGERLWRSGNTLFYRLQREAAGRHLGRADRVVLYERATA